MYLTRQLPDLPGPRIPSPPSNPHSMDNCPTWVSRNNDSKSTEFQKDSSTSMNNNRNKGRLWIFAAVSIVSTHHYNTPSMPLDVDNFLPGIELWIDHNAYNTIYVMWHLNTFAAMSTYDHASVVDEYPPVSCRQIQPIWRQCTNRYPSTSLRRKDLDRTGLMHGIITIIVCYWLRYEQRTFNTQFMQLKSCYPYFLDTRVLDVKACLSCVFLT